MFSGTPCLFKLHASIPPIYYPGVFPPIAAAHLCGQARGGVAMPPGAQGRTLRLVSKQNMGSSRSSSHCSELSRSFRRAGNPPSLQLNSCASRARQF